MKNSTTKGIHYLIDLYGCDNEQINNKEELKNILTSAVEGSGAVILNKYFYQFSPKGITGFLLLSASHISIHTWPEESHATLDVFTCINKTETKEIVKKILDAIVYKKKNMSSYKRGFLLNKESD